MMSAVESCIFVISLMILWVCSYIFPEVNDNHTPPIIGGYKEIPNREKYLIQVVHDARNGDINIIKYSPDLLNVSGYKPSMRYAPPTSNIQIKSIFNHGRCEDRARLIHLLLKHGYKQSLDKLRFLTDAECYKSMRSNKQISHNDARADRIAEKILYQLGKRIPTDKFTSMLDIGCGDGMITLAVAQRLNITDVNCLEIIDGTTPDIQYYKPGDEINRQFDLITAFFSLHHIQDLDAMAQKIYDLLAPGGLLVIKEHDCWDPADAMLVDIEHSIFLHMEGKPITDDHVYHYKNYYAYDDVFDAFTYVWADHHSTTGRPGITPTRGYICIYKKELTPPIIEEK